MNKTILITGAGTGIGRDTALALAQRGHQVIAAVHNAQQAEAFTALVASKGLGQERIQVIEMDITQEAHRQKILDYPLDVLINNAGVGESGSLAEVDMARVRQVFEVNLFATLALTQLALRGMIARQNGTVLMVSSIAGRVPTPFLMPYGMSKFALSAAGAGLRAELDQLRCNVHVSLIEPGAIHTGFNQAMTDRKYAWMGEQSYFAGHIARLKKEEKRTFAFLEAKSTRGIVACMVKASEARRPRLRYTSPWIQGFGVRMARMFGV